VPPCFPEPTIDDPRPAVDDEPRPAWLRRSTWGEAAQARDFYNRNLAALPEAIASRLCRELHADPTLARHFELVVGRTLQELGADRLDYEVLGSEGQRVDWLAHFDDGPVSVEATVPVVNAVVGDTFAENRRAVAAVVAAAPPGWFVFLGRVPRFGHNDSLRWFQRELASVFRDAPAATPEGHWSIERAYDNGRLHVNLLPMPNLTAAAQWGAGPGVGHVDDTSVVVARAIEGKRDQARGAVKPVLAAIATFGYGAWEVNELDKAILGRSVHELETGRLYFNPNGVFRPAPIGREPIFAGALVFVGLGVSAGPDPILYRHPRYRGPLPAAIAGLRERFATDRQIEERPPIREGIVSALGWPTA
jgi:hypothetical protein